MAYNLGIAIDLIIISIKYSIYCTISIMKCIPLQSLFSVHVCVWAEYIPHVVESCKLGYLVIRKGLVNGWDWNIIYLQFLPFDLKYYGSFNQFNSI